MTLVKRSLALALALMLLFVFISCDIPLGNAQLERKSRISYDYFDTVATLYSFSGDSNSAFDENFRAFEAELSLCHKLFDIYHEYDGMNNVATVNKNAGKDPVKVDGRLIDLLIFAKEMHALTDGAVNVAMGSVLKIWHEYREQGKRIPEQAELLSASLHCDIDSVIINEAESTVYLSDPEMSLDLGSVAKGYAIDRCAAVLRARGAYSYAIDVGGNIYAIGSKSDGSAFKTGIENPTGGDYSAWIEVADGSVATSGDYQRYYIYGGVRYHHIINHETLFPAYFHRSVSIYSDSAALSDALSTALFNMDTNSAKALVKEKFPSVREVIFVGESGEGVSFRPLT